MKTNPLRNVPGRSPSRTHLVNIRTKGFDAFCPSSLVRRHPKFAAVPCCIWRDFRLVVPNQTEREYVVLAPGGPNRRRIVRSPFALKDTDSALVSAVIEPAEVVDASVEIGGWIGLPCSVKGVERCIWRIEQGSITFFSGSKRIGITTQRLCQGAHDAACESQFGLEAMQGFHPFEIREQDLRHRQRRTI